MIKHIDLELLDEGTRKMVLAKYRVALMAPDVKLRMEEAAWLYGYQYSTLRWLVAHGKMRSTGNGLNRRVTHAAVRAYRKQRLKKVPTVTERKQQTKLA